MDSEKKVRVADQSLVLDCTNQALEMCFETENKKLDQVIVEKAMNYLFENPKFGFYFVHSFNNN
jgi:hypothetical protein